MRNGDREAGERRKFTRVAASAVLEIMQIDRADPELASDRYTPAESLNLSVGGLLLTTDLELDIGALVKMKLRLSEISAFKPAKERDRSGEAPDLVAVGEVVRVRGAREIGFEVAVRFVAIHDGDVAALRRLVGER